MNPLDILPDMSFLEAYGRKPTIPGTNVRVPRFLDPRRVYMNPERMANPFNVRGGALAGLGLAAANEAFGRPLPQKDLLAAEVLLTMPGPYAPVAAMAVHDINNPLGVGTVTDPKTGKLTPMSMSERRIRMERGEEDPYPKFDAEGNPPLGPYTNEFKVPSPNDLVLGLNNNATGLAYMTRAERDRRQQGLVERKPPEVLDGSYPTPPSVIMGGPERKPEPRFEDPGPTGRPVQIGEEVPFDEYSVQSGPPPEEGSGQPKSGPAPEEGSGQPKSGETSGTDPKKLPKLDPESQKIVEGLLRAVTGNLRSGIKDDEEIVVKTDPKVGEALEKLSDSQAEIKRALRGLTERGRTQVGMQNMIKQAYDQFTGGENVIQV